MSKVSPGKIFEQVSNAVPEECREHMIIVGSLAAALRLFGENMPVQTKDIDCVLSPIVTAVESGEVVARKLLENGWTQKEDGEYRKPGSATTSADKLPVVRLYPPNEKEWYIELLTVPDSEHAEGKEWKRLKLPDGYYGLPSFRFLSIAAFKPFQTQSGIYCARPEMMVLSHLLEHPEIRPKRMTGLMELQSVKRSNKDLGRVLAIAWLSTDSESWPELWIEALRACFPQSWRTVASGAGSGLRSLLASPDDLEEAFHTCIVGLLASSYVTLDNLRIAGERLMKDAVEPLEMLIHRPSDLS